MNHAPHDVRDLLQWELAQRREAGYDVSGVESSIKTALADVATPNDGIAKLLEELESTERDPSWDEREPDDLETILADAPRLDVAPVFDDAELLRRVHGGWLGRCAGNNLGKPVENGDHWTPAHLKDYLQRADAYPLVDYVPVLDPMPEGFELRECWPVTTRGRIQETARDDDLDYTVLGLHLLETYGVGFTPADVAREWLDRLPYTQTYTAERVVYRNLVLGLDVPEVRLSYNPYREWVGAQIRGDAFGLAFPGDPRSAAALAYQDAVLSHTANGIYGEMWAAALVAAAFTADGPRAALDAALACVPRDSRLAEALRLVNELHGSGIGWEEARDRIEVELGHYSWVHTVNNAALVAAGLLWGDGDYTRSVGLTVQGGWDTDSSAATTGCVAGILVGADGIPAHWTDPLNDTLRSAIRGFDGSRISDLAARTVAVARSRSHNA